MMKITILAVFIFLLAACDGGDRPALSRANREALYVDAMKDKIRAQLKDPTSSEFRGVFFSETGGAKVVCGEVNSKNAFGGYTGFQRFIAGGKLVFLEEDTGAETMTSTWHRFCGR